MIKLSQILRESQDKVSTAVEAKLRKQGVHLDGRSSPSISDSNSSALKAAALDRIEDLLGAVLTRLEQGQPVAQDFFSSNTAAAGAQAPREGPATEMHRPRSSASTMPESELMAYRNQPSLQPRAAAGAQTRNVSAQSSPRSERFILDERERAREKLERYGSTNAAEGQKKVNGEKSHWSNDVGSFTARGHLFDLCADLSACTDDCAFCWNQQCGSHLLSFFSRQACNSEHVCYAT